jgi:hypothetical protein
MPVVTTIYSLPPVLGVCSEPLEQLKNSNITKADSSGINGFIALQHKATKQVSD